MIRSMLRRLMPELCRPFAEGSGKKQVPQSRRNSNIILWHPAEVRPAVGALPGGRSPSTPNDHRLPAASPSGWKKSEFVLARALTHGGGFCQAITNKAAFLTCNSIAL
jgi:hypothetical protein